ncbi:unnamed protein product, partial [Nesidiocoris tenuis]
IDASFERWVRKEVDESFITRVPSHVNSNFHDPVAKCGSKRILARLPAKVPIRRSDTEKDHGPIDKHANRTVLMEAFNPSSISIERMEHGEVNLPSSCRHASTYKLAGRRALANIKGSRWNSNSIEYRGNRRNYLRADAPATHISTRGENLFPHYLFSKIYCSRTLVRRAVL